MVVENSDSLQVTSFIVSVSDENGFRCSLEEEVLGKAQSCNRCDLENEVL